MKNSTDITSTPSGPVEQVPSWALDPAAERLGHFILGPMLGRGGMGVVHEAWDDRLLRRVAIKLVSVPDPLLYLRFLREAEHQARVEHPHVCRIYEASVHGDTPFIAMQLIHGGSLQALGHGFPAHDLARLMAQAASALQAAHEAGLVHRDIKPTNLLLDIPPAGMPTLYIVDFGLALDAQESRLSLGLQSPGTPAYMSPEQSRGQERLGPSSDLYSLAASFQPFFTGQDPWQGPTVPAAQGKQPSRPPSGGRGSTGRRTLHRDLEAILRKCLEPDPGRRYDSARTLREDLDRWLEGRPTLARPLGLLGRATRLLRRRRALALALGFAALCAALPAAWGLRHRWAAYRQLAYAERFARDLKELEDGLRKERMLPTHDIQPAEQRLRKRMEELRNAMRVLGPQAQGPGLTALGRGHLELREFKEALECLDEAWKRGHRSPSLAWARGVALAERYMTEVYPTASISDPAQRKKKRYSLRQELAEPARQAIREGRSPDHGVPAYREALDAYLAGEPDRCLDKCREATRQAPWFWEARFLEAQALLLRNYDIDALVLEDPERFDKDMEAALATLREASRLAPSDDRAASMTVKVLRSRISTSTNVQGKGTSFASKQLEEARLAMESALTIRPRDPDVLLNLASLAALRGSHAYNNGLDARKELLQDVRRVYEGLQGQEPQGSMRRFLASTQRTIGLIQYQRGEDPRLPLEESIRLFGAPTPARSTIWATLAIAAIERGRDPWPYLRAGEEDLARSGESASGQVFLHTLWAQLLSLRMEIEAMLGTDPSGSYRAALRQLRQARRPGQTPLVQSEIAARLYISAASWKILGGGDGRPELRLARKALASQGGAGKAPVEPSMALPRAYLWEATQDVQEGRFAGPALARARSACLACARRTPGRHDAWSFLAMVELLAAEDARGRGAAALPFLERALGASQKCLSLYAADPEHWLTQSSIRRWMAREDAGRSRRHWAEAAACLARARALNPWLHAVQAEGLLLAIQRDGASTEPLAALLKRNPCLGAECRRVVQGGN